MSYDWIKLAHLAFAVCHVSLFMFRLAIIFQNNPQQPSLALKYSIYLNDSLLLIAGIYLVYRLQLPLLHIHWLSVKLCLIILYILFGYLALNTVTSFRYKMLYAILAISSLSGIIYLAINKTISL